jgi:hypothetical protein
MKFKHLPAPKSPKSSAWGLPFGTFETFGGGCAGNFVCQVFVNRLLIHPVRIAESTSVGKPEI